MNNTNNNGAWDWFDTSVDERHEVGKVVGNKQRLRIRNARGVNNYKQSKFLNTMRARNLYGLE